MSLPSAVLFDMDGTLIDSEPLWFASEVDLMAELGGVWTLDDQERCLGVPLIEVADYLRERSGTHLTKEDVCERLLLRMEHALRSTPLAWQPGARELLRETRDLGLPTALVSASWARLIDAVSGRFDSELGVRAFDAVVPGDEVGNGKPHPEPYLTAAALLGADPADCLALEDSPTGVTAALAAGCRVVAIPHVAEVRHTGAAIVTSLEGRTTADLWQAASIASRG